MGNVRIGPGWAVVLAIFLGAVGCKDDAPSSTGAPTETARRPLAVGIAIPSYVHAIAWLADDRGEFEQAGLDATVTVTGGSAAALRTLIAKQSDVVLAGGDSVLKASRAGADVVIVASFVSRFYHRIVAKKSLTKPADLRDKKIGLPFLGGPQDMAVRYALRKHDLAYGEEVSVLGLGKELNRLAALEHGDIDATTSQTPPARLAQMGLHVLVDPTADDVPFPYMVMAVRRDVLAARRTDLAGALAALCRAADFYRASANRAESLAAIAEHIAGSDTAGAQAARYESAGPSFLSMPPTPSVEALETVGRLSERALSADERKHIIDPTLLAELQTKGHCKP